MTDDNILLLFSFLIYWVTLFLLTLKSSNRKKVLMLNLPIHILYSSCFLYALLYKSQGGASLLWWFYLILFIAIHWIINLVTLLIQLRKNKTGL